MLVRIHDSSTMKFTLVLFIALTIAGLGQAAHQFPDFGKGPLHEDIQDILDLVPVKEIHEIISEYLSEDPEVKDAIKFFETTPISKNMMVKIEAIPEVINLFNYLHKESIHIYDIINYINEALDIDQLVPPSSDKYTIMKMTGGFAGLVKDVANQLNFGDFIHIYVQKLQTSPSFVSFVNELKTDNFQQIVNKVYKIKSFQILLNGLRSKGVNTEIVADILFMLYGITVPNDKNDDMGNLEDDLLAFVKLINLDLWFDIIVEYKNTDEEVQEAILFLLTEKFHGLLNSVEDLQEFKAVIIHLQKAGYNIISKIQFFHQMIDMGEYVPPETESIIKSQFGLQEAGGIKGMIEELRATLPTEQIDALYEKKLKTSEVFADFIVTLTSDEMKKEINELCSTEAFLKFDKKIREKGVELQDIVKLWAEIYGIAKFF